MAMLLEPPVAARSANTGGVSVSPNDLAEVLARFNEAAASLQATHEVLRGQVSKLEDELAETRRQLRRASRLASLGEMAAGIAHEIRNPLGSIKLYAAVLCDDLTDRPAERDVARKITGAVDRLNAVVGDVLSFSRRMSVRPEQIVVGDLLDQAIETCDGYAGETVRLERAYESSRGMTVACDPNLMHQALLNVIRNAVEAVAEHERTTGMPARMVRVSVAPRSVLEPDGSRVAMTAIVVEDNGPGVPHDVMDRVFNPFFTTRNAGTGLGLAIVHRIMDAHGGRVTIRNNEHDNAHGAHGCAGATVELMIPSEPAGALQIMED